MSNETVKLNVSIQINTEGEIDTGLTIPEWNALSNAERAKIAGDIWQDEASSNDHGGISVVTPGAEEA
jgi:hypothetical protein